MLGIDPLYLANEGTMVVMAPESEAEGLLEALRKGPYSANAAVIGRITEELEKILFIGPFSYAEAADIFAGNGIPVKAAVFAAAVTAATVLLAILYYRKKDLAA